MAWTHVITALVVVVAAAARELVQRVTTRVAVGKLLSLVNEVVHVANVVVVVWLSFDCVVKSRCRRRKEPRQAHFLPFI